MEKVHITLTFYFEIKDSEIYGGDGEIGYAEQKMDLETCDLGNVKLLEQPRARWKDSLDYAEYQ